MDFEAFPKIPRLNRDIVITEKIDGTNAAVLIEELPIVIPGLIPAPESDRFLVDGSIYRVQAQARKRLITPDSDNFGFARWVRDNAEELVRLLGPGRHFGEWWGQGIQRGYGQTGKRFSLFNPTFKFGDPATSGPGGAPSGLLYNEIDTVPVLYEGPFDQNEIDAAVGDLILDGSVAAPGFMNPEGIIVYHTASRGLFKVTCVGDEKPKGSSE